MRAKTNMSKRLILAKRGVLVGFAMLFVATTFMPPAPAYADRFDDQIKALQAQADQYRNQAGALRSQAATLQNEIAALQAQEAALQAQIDANTAKAEQLSQQIVEAQQKLEGEKNLLGQNLRSMYLESQITPLEMIASSKSISDFIDRQEYRNKLRDQTTRTIADVKQTQAELKQKKTDLDNTLADQNAQRAELAAQHAQQADLLARTRGQEAAYQSLVNQSNASIASLRAQQAAANRALGGNVVPGDPGHGGYPNNWNNAPLDAYSDPWGMYTRECVSYAAFRVWNSGRTMPYGFGNANQWPGNAARRNIPTGSTPKVGSIGISMTQPYGHAVYVEAILDNGKIYVSQYNYDFGTGPGKYSEMTVSAGSFVYIYF